MDLQSAPISGLRTGLQVNISSTVYRSVLSARGILKASRTYVYNTDITMNWLEGSAGDVPKIEYFQCLRSAFVSMSTGLRGKRYVRFYVKAPIQSY